MQEFEWLQAKVRWLIDSCRETSSYGLRAVYNPVAFGKQYRCFYVRDFTYMVEGAPEYIPGADVREALDYFLKITREDGKCVERISTDGTPVYICHGSLPTADAAPFLVKLFNEYMQMEKDLDFLALHFPVLRRGLEMTPTDGASGLVWIDPANPYTSYGFTDTIAKTGKVLFCSLLMLESWGIMADFARLLNAPRGAQLCEDRKEQIKEHLVTLWSEEDGMFLAASEDCRQTDLWGSAYACVIDAVSVEQRERISNWFLHNQDNAVYKGHLRHLPAPQYWSRLLLPEGSPPGTFQNGPYWSTPSGWLAQVLEAASPGAGLRILGELVNEFRENGIWECMGSDGYRRYKDNVSSAVLPYKAFKTLMRNEGT